ncbi:L-threonylcarbamoyladenylate synthase [Limibacter armeniacum]|uniref:L-threonylcarbamoyladenylate synthase n=1 Tax=Limibacter armeniacum TaxID=466084 RepID=UPI002FE60EE4
MIGKDIGEAKAHLEAGRLVAIPTETVYGLAGNALNPEAVADIFKTKQRPSFDPLIVHCDSVEKVKSYVSAFPELAEKLADHFWPGSLTMILPRGEMIHDLVTSGLETVAVRVPNHPLTLSLLEQLDFPVAAPSANPFGYVSPTSAQHVDKNLGHLVPYILDGGECEVGIESTIIGFPEGVPTIYRKGGISIEDIEAVIGKVEVNAHSSSKPSAPGMLDRHYSPGVHMLIGNVAEMLPEYQGKKVATLTLQSAFEGVEKTHQFQLSPKGDLAEAAKNLFRYLRELDVLQPDVILVELVPEKGLGVAINDRLRRAAAK